MTWPLPDNAFVPGQTTRPTDGPVLEAATKAPTDTDPGAWRENRTYLYGVDLHNNGFHWEAHEVWEPVWMGCGPNSHVRAMMQGLIQLTNACLKLRMGRERAFDRLLDIAQGHFSASGHQPLMGLSPTTLQNQVQACLRDRLPPHLALDWDHP